MLRFATFGGALLVVFGLLILWAALRPTPSLEDLVLREGRIVAAELDDVSSAKGNKSVLRLDLDDSGDPVYLHPKTPELRALRAELTPGTAIRVRVEPHARQLLAGTPLARGRTEVWELALVDGDSTLVPYATGAAHRRRDRVAWGLASSAALLVGIYGLSQARRNASREWEPTKSDAEAENVG